MTKKNDPRNHARLEQRWGRKRQRPLDYHKARDGDSLTVSFECDLCILRKLKSCDPLAGSPQDKHLMACIRRMNLDAFWSWATATVKGNMGKSRQMVYFSETVGLSGPFIHEGPFPNFDHCGYEVAINMILHSTNRGRYRVYHGQYDTIRKAQSTFGNQVRSSPQKLQKLWYCWTIKDTNGW